MAISIDDIKKLRAMTGAGLADVKKALTEAEGDFDKAKELLRERGLAIAAKRSDRETSNGCVDSFQLLLPLENTGFCEFLSCAQFTDNTGFLKFSFQFFQRSFNSFAFFNGNNDHKKYLFLLIS